MRRVICSSVVAALTLLGDSLLYVVLPLEAAALGLSGFQVGLLLSGNRFVRMLTNSGASWLMRRFPPGPSFTAATALAAVTTALYTLTPAFVPFLLARLLWGLCFSTLRLGNFITVLAEATDRSRGRLMGLYRSISRLGSFVAVVAGGALFDAAGYRTAMLTMAAGTALAVPLAIWGGPGEPEERLERTAGGPHPPAPAPVGTGEGETPPPTRLKPPSRPPRRQAESGEPARQNAPPPAGTGAGETDPPTQPEALPRPSRREEQSDQPTLEAAHSVGTGEGETPPPTRPESPPRPSGRERGAGGEGRSRLLAVNWSAFALSFVARGVVTATLALFLDRAFGDRFGPGGAIGVATVASWLIGVRWLAEIGLATPLGALSDRTGRLRSAVGWSLAAAAGVLALALAPAIGLAVGAVVLLFVASSGLGATLDAAAGDLAPPARRAQVMSAYADWSDLGAAFGPLLALTFADAIGLRPMYAVGALLLATGAGALLLAFPRGGGRLEDVVA